MRIVLSGGGTGGHIYPALAIATECKHQYPTSVFLYIGTEAGLERRLVSKTDLHFQTIDVTGFQRKLSLYNIKTVIKFIRAVAHAKQILKEFKPDVVIGTGGYVCAPVVYAAAKLGVMTVIHEQNVIPGLTNKLLSRYVNTIAISFEQSKTYFKKAKQVVYCGNPRATTVVHADKKQGYTTLGIADQHQMILISGGSQGAQAINETVIHMIPLLKQLNDVHVVYVTGQRYYESLCKAVAKYNVTYSHLHIVPYIHNMPEVLAATTIAVSRAGASSLAELTALGIPSILIPSPNVTNNHQEVNARSLEAVGAAIVLNESQLCADVLFEHIQTLINDENKRNQMSMAAKACGKPEAAANVVAELKKLVKR